MDSRTMRTEIALYRLLRVPGLAADSLGRVLTAWREEPALLDRFWNRPAADYRQRWGLSAAAARFLQDADDEEEAGIAGAALRAARSSDIELMSVLEADYASLYAARGLPPVLFTRGNQDLLWRAGAAIPHSRDAAEDALGWGALLAKALCEAGIGLVTGHNREGYRRSAAAAKRAGAPLTVVLDRPLHASASHGPSAEPVVTARLWDDQFRPERELVVSAVPPGARWLPTHAQGRDALIVRLAGIVTAGDVRPGGHIAALCASAAGAGRTVFRSPFCRAEIEAPCLPREVEAAAETILRAVGLSGETPAWIASDLTIPQPGWVARRWAAEGEAFVESLAPLVESYGWVERRPAGSLAGVTAGFGCEGASGSPAAIVQLPRIGEDEAGELVLIGRRTGAGVLDSGDVLLLSPGEPIGDLAALRSYLARCRARVRQALIARPR